MNGKINSLRDQPSKAGICLKTKYKKPIPTICVKKNPISPIKISLPLLCVKDFVQFIVISVSFIPSLTLVTSTSLTLLEKPI